MPKRTQKSIKKTRREGQQRARIDKARIKREMSPDSEEEELSLEIEKLKSIIVRCKTDLQHPSFAGSPVIISKLNNAVSQLKEKEEKLKTTLEKKKDESI